MKSATCHCRSTFGKALYYDPRYYAGNVSDPDGYSSNLFSRAGSTPEYGNSNRRFFPQSDFQLAIIHSRIATREPRLSYR
jgi:hypothetical protein